MTPYPVSGIFSFLLKSSPRVKLLQNTVQVVLRCHCLATASALVWSRSNGEWHQKDQKALTSRFGSAPVRQRYIYPDKKITWLTPVSETKSETDCMAVYRNRFSRNGHHIIYIAHTVPGSIFRCKLIYIHLQFLISRLPWNDWTNGHEPYLKCTLAIFHAPRPELRVSHRSSCALTDIHRDITGRSQGHYQSGYLQPVFTDLPISWSPLSDGPGNFARIYK